MNQSRVAAHQAQHPVGLGVLASSCPLGTPRGHLAQILGKSDPP
jgi:hypothetical protein